MRDRCLWYKMIIIKFTIGLRMSAYDINPIGIFLSGFREQAPCNGERLRFSYMWEALDQLAGRKRSLLDSTRGHISDSDSSSPSPEQIRALLFLAERYKSPDAEDWERTVAGALDVIQVSLKKYPKLSNTELAVSLFSIAAINPKGVVGRAARKAFHYAYTFEIAVALEKTVAPADKERAAILHDTMKHVLCPGESAAIVETIHRDLRQSQVLRACTP